MVKGKPQSYVLTVIVKFKFLFCLWRTTTDVVTRSFPLSCYTIGEHSHGSNASTCSALGSWLPQQGSQALSGLWNDVLSSLTFPVIDNLPLSSIQMPLSTLLNLDVLCATFVWLPSNNLRTGFMLALAVDVFSHLNFALLTALFQTFVLNSHEGSFPISLPNPHTSSVSTWTLA